MCHWLMLWNSFRDGTEIGGIIRDRGNGMAGSAIDGVIYKNLRGVIPALRSCSLVHKVWCKCEDSDQRGRIIKFQYFISLSILHKPLVE